jgi:hypothetical protein
VLIVLKHGSLSLLESSGPLQARTGKDDISLLPTKKKNDTGGKGEFQNLAEKEPI